jgi:hypothetical protein
LLHAAAGLRRLLWLLPLKAAPAPAAVAMRRTATAMGLTPPTKSTAGSGKLAMGEVYGGQHSGNRQLEGDPDQQLQQGQQQSTCHRQRWPLQRTQQTLPCQHMSLSCGRTTPCCRG